VYQVLLLYKSDRIQYSVHTHLFNLPHCRSCKAKQCISWTPYLKKKTYS